MVGCGERAISCPEPTVDLLTEEVFLTACPVGEGTYLLFGAGFSAGETIDLVFDAESLEPVAVRAGTARADPAGRLRVEVRIPPAARYVRAYGSRGRFALAPLPRGR